MELLLFLSMPPLVLFLYTIAIYVYTGAFYPLSVRLLMLLLSQLLGLHLETMRPLAPTLNDSVLSFYSGFLYVCAYASLWTCLYDQASTYFYYNAIISYFLLGPDRFINQVAWGVIYSDLSTEESSKELNAIPNTNRLQQKYTILHFVEFFLSWLILYLFGHEAKFFIFTAYCLLVSASMLVFDGLETERSVCAISLPVTLVQAKELPMYTFFPCALVLLYGIVRQYSASEDPTTHSAYLFDDALGRVPDLCKEMLSLTKKQEKNDVVLKLMNVCAALLYSTSTEQLMAWAANILSIELNCPLMLINDNAVHVGRLTIKQADVDAICRHIRNDSRATKPYKMVAQSSVDHTCRMYNHLRLGKFYAYLGGRSTIVAFIQPERLHDFMEIASRVESYLQHCRTFFADCSKAANTILNGYLQLAEMEASWRSLLDTSRRPFYTFWTMYRDRILSLRGDSTNKKSLTRELLLWSTYLCIVSDMFRLEPVGGTHYEFQRKREAPLALYLLEIYGSRILNADCQIVASKRVQQRFGLFQFFTSNGINDQAVLADMLRMDMAIYHAIMAYISSSFVLQPFHNSFRCKIARGSLFRKLELSDLLAYYRNNNFTNGKTRKVESCSELVSYIDELTNEIILISSQCILNFCAWFSVTIDLPISKLHVLDIVDGTTKAESSQQRRSIMHSLQYRSKEQTGAASSHSLFTDTCSSPGTYGMVLLDNKNISARAFLSAIHILNLIVCFHDVSECCIYIPDYAAGQTSIL